MSADTLADRFQKIGQPATPPATDTLSSTPIGSATIPAPDARLTYYKIANGGTP